MAGLCVTSPAIQAVNIRTVKSHASRLKAWRKLLLPDRGILSRHGSGRPGMPGLPHAGVAESLMQMADPAFAFYRRDWNFFIPARLTR